MSQPLQALMHDLGSTDDRIRMQAMQSLLQATENKVAWVYDVWDALLEKLDEANSYQHSIICCGRTSSILCCRLQK